MKIERSKSRVWGKQDTGHNFVNNKLKLRKRERKE